MTTSTMLLFACLALAGCAAPVAKPPMMLADAGAASMQQCWREARVGSQIPVTVCDTDHTEAERIREINDIHDRMLRANTLVRAVGN